MAQRMSGGKACVVQPVGPVIADSHQGTALSRQDGIAGRHHGRVAANSRIQSGEDIVVGDGNRGGSEIEMLLAAKVMTCMYGESLVRSSRCVLGSGYVYYAANRPLISSNEKMAAVDAVGEIGTPLRRPVRRPHITKRELIAAGGGVVRYGGGNSYAGGLPFWDHRRAGCHNDSVDSAPGVDDGEVGSRNRNGLAGAVDAHGFVPLEVVAVIDGG